ncbi:MAG: phosphatase PAP2 family protein [Thaumarchaeota archaeon]|nr:MAG: phosphatase PAP2 family protein [Nitrososphaerota archaeon]
MWLIDFADATNRRHMLIYARRLGEPVEFEAPPTCSGGRPQLRLGLLPCLERVHLPDRHRTLLEPERIGCKLWDGYLLVDYDAIRERGDPSPDWSHLSILKGAYFRPRPYQILSGVYNPLGLDEGSSFPSGHATRAFAVAALITMQKGKKYALLLLLSVGAAFSRVIIGLHFPSDVLGGAFLGIALAVVSVSFLSRYVYPRLPPRFFMKGRQDMDLKSAAT